MISCVHIVSTCLKAVCWLPYSYGNYIRENLDEKVNFVKKINKKRQIIFT